MKKLFLSALLATALFSTPAMAKVEPDIIRTTYGDFDSKGQFLSTNESVLKAMDFKKTEKQANQGDANAQFYLAKMYDLGIHTQKDDKKAMEWYKKSAENGNANAMNNYADYLLAKTVKWNKKSAENDNVKAMNNDTDLTMNEVVSWYQKASELNQPHAKMNLAMYYIASKTDIQKGVDLLLELGKNGFAPAYFLLSQIATTELPEDIYNNTFKDANEPFKYAIQSAEMGYSPAQVYLAQFSSMLFLFGADIDESGEKAKDKTQQLSKTKQNIINAYSWAKRACNNGNEQGCDALAFYDDLKDSKETQLAKESCDSEKDPKVKQEMCQAYQFYQELHQEFESIDKRYQ